MGSQRKNRTPQQQQQRRFFLVSPDGNHSSTHHNNHHDHPTAAAVKEINNHYDHDDEDDTERTLDFSKVLQDVEGSLVGTMTSSVMAITGLFSTSPSGNNGGSFRVTWKELMYLVLTIVVLAGLSIFMGVAAGVTISIHYFDTHATPSFPRLEARERDLGPHQRVTTLDYSISSSNILQPFIGSTSSSSSDAENDAMDLTLGRVITMSESGQRSVLLVVEESPPLQTDGNETRKNSPLSVCRNDTALTDVDGSGNEILLDGHYKPYKHKGPPGARFQLTASKVHPAICSDGVNIGYDDWNTLKAAVEEANALSAERFMKWNEYFSSLDAPRTTSSDWFHKLLRDAATRQPDDFMTCTGNDDDDDVLQYYYDEEIIFTICPGSTLKARRGPIFINAENIIIECGDPEEYNYMRAAKHAASIPSSTQSSFFREIPTCTLDVGGTHLSFGPHAKNVLVRGLVFQSAKTSSLAFHYDGAQASFEDCIWMDNAGVHGKYGAVADVNSTSNVNFYRCEIGSSLANPPVNRHGDSPPPGHHGVSGFASFLSLRK